MVHRYPHKLKVYECSIPNCDNYTLQYYYFYILRSDQIIELVTDEDYVVENFFSYEGYKYLIFWVKKAKNEIITKEKIPLQIAYYLVKTEDSYVIKKNTYTCIEENIKQQYEDVSYIKYKIPNILSTVD